MRTLRFLCCVCVLSTLLVPGRVSAQPAAVPAPAADTAVVEFQLPPGATIRMGDQDYPAQKNAVFTPLEPGKIYQQMVEVRLADGTKLERSLLLSGGWHIRLVVPPANSPRPEVVVQGGHSGVVFTLAFSPDERFLLSGSVDGTAILWDAKTGQQIRRLAGFTGNVMSAAFSADGQRLLLGSADGSASIWAHKTGERLLNLEPPPDMRFPEEIRSRMQKLPINSVAIRPDDAVAAISTISKVVLFDAHTGAVLRTLDSPEVQVLGVNSIAFSPDGTTLIGGTQASKDVAAVLWNSQTGEVVRTLRGQAGQTVVVACSPDGQMAATGSLDKVAVLWDMRTGQPLHTLTGHAEQVWSVAFSRDGRLVLTASPDGTAMLWDAHSGKLLTTLRPEGLYAFRDIVRSIAFSPDGRQVVTGMGTGTIAFWDLPSGTQRRTLPGLSMNTPAVCFSPDGRQARTVNGYFALNWDAATGQPTLGAIREITAIPFVASRAGSPFDRTAQQVILNLPDHAAVLVDLYTGRKIQQFQGASGDVAAMDMSSDGRWALVRLYHNRIPPYSLELWDVSTGQRFELPVTPTLTALAISADGRYGAVIGEGSSVTLLDLQTRQAVRTLQPVDLGGPTATFSLAFSRDGSRIVGGDDRGNVIFWDTATGQILRFARGHSGVYCPVWCVAFSPDGRWAISGGLDNAVVVWNVETGSPLCTLRGHTAMPIAVSISSDGRHALSGSHDGTARLWDVATGDELVKLIGMAGISEGKQITKDWLAITPEGLFDGSAGAREKVTFRMGDGLSVVPVDRFFQDFYRPGLLTTVWKGRRELPEEKLFGSKPPTVEIVSPAQGGTVESEHVVLEATVTDQGHGVKGPWLLHNGVRVLAPGKVERQGNVVRRQFQIALVEGKNRFEVRAASADGSWESEPARRELIYEKPLPKPDAYLLAVGVGKYSDESLRLSYPTVDAEAMADLFQKRGPAFYRHVHLVKLLDERATRSGILQAIGQLAARARPQDTLIVFLAGQGMLVDQQYYFLPHELRRQEKTLDEAVRGQGLLAAELGEKLAAVPALKRMVIFDTGQSGMTVTQAKRSRNPFAFRGAIERLSRAEGAFTLAALAVSPEAREVPDLGHGILSYTLFAGLGAANHGPLKDRSIRADEQVAQTLELMGFASVQTRLLTRQYWGQEQEVQHGSAGASFPLLPMLASATVSKPPSAEVPEPKAEPTTPQSSQTSSVAGVGKNQRDLFLVAVGINRYAQGALNLRFAGDDARAIARLFRERGQRAYGKVECTELIDQQATKPNIMKTLEDAAGKIRAEDVLAVFLAGHGTLVGQRYYFVPHEFHWKQDTLEQDIREQALPADVLADGMAKAKATRRLLILDTCASGGALDLGRSGRNAFAFRGAIESLGKNQGTFTLAASAAGQEAQEIETLGHGVLTYTLLAGLRAVKTGPLQDRWIAPNDPSGLIDVLDWFGFASSQVPKLTERYLGRGQDIQSGGQGMSFSILPSHE